MTAEEIREVERIVTEQVLKCLPVTTTVMSLEEAKQSGAKALFEEKYGNEVRVIEAQGFSKELCGGTHVTNTGNIGLVKVIREEGIGSGIRRINAVTGFGALDLFQRMENAVGMLTTMLGGDMDSLMSRAEELLDEKKVLERKNKELQVKAAMSDIENSVKPRASIDGVDLIAERFDDITPDLLRQVGDRIRQKFPLSLMLLAGVGSEGRVSLTAMASDEAVKKGAHAGKVLQGVAAVLGGKGGGRPNLAQGGAQSADKLEEAFAKAPEIFEGLMRGK